MSGAAERIESGEAAGTILVNGEAAVCDRRGALYFPGHRLLVVSDLHLEKGAAFARRGMLVPPYDTAATLLRLGAVLTDYAPAAVISLGDSFHDRHGAAFLPDMFRDTLAGFTAGRDWFWVTGNHDPQPPVGLPGHSVPHLSVGSLSFRHEPSPRGSPGEIAGHLHPCARIVQRGRSVRRRCFASDGRRLIMPAFGSFTGSLNVLDTAYSGLFEHSSLMAHMIGADRVYPIAGRMLQRD